MATKTKDPNIRGYLALELCTRADNPGPYVTRFYNLRDNPFTLVFSEIMGDRQLSVFRRASAMLYPVAESSMGNYFYEKNEPTKAVYYYGRAVWYGQIEALVPMARAKMCLFDFPGALELFRRAADLPETSNDACAYYGAMLKILNTDRQALAEADRYIERSVRAGWPGASFAVQMCRHEGVGHKQLQANCGKFIMNVRPHAVFGPDMRASLLPEPRK
jgi:tetratricopeptide (TPR) repeat protein